MKLVTFANEHDPERLGVLEGKRVIDLSAGMKRLGLDRNFPSTLLGFLEGFERNRRLVRENWSRLTAGEWVFDPAHVRLRPPLPFPRGFRDFYAFERHVRAIHEKSGKAIVPEWYEIPVFYFSNHNAMKGAEERIEFPPECRSRDFELEVAAVVCREGKNIAVEEAENYLGGLMILNDWTDRDIQAKEVKVIGPAKSKDFATSLGPWLVTLDELAGKRTEPGKYDLAMVARVNGRQYSRGNLRDIYWSFCQMLAFASRGTTVYPGEVLGSGTVGTGCILELGAEKYGWLESGDIVELEVEGLGVLKNTIA